MTFWRYLKTHVNSSDLIDESAIPNICWIRWYERLHASAAFNALFVSFFFTLMAKFESVILFDVIIFMIINCEIKAIHMDNRCVVHVCGQIRKTDISHSWSPPLNLISHRNETRVSFSEAVHRCNTFFVPSIAHHISCPLNWLKTLTCRRKYNQFQSSHRAKQVYA